MLEKRIFALPLLLAALACEQKPAEPPKKTETAAEPAAPAAPAQPEKKCVKVGYSDWVGWHPWTVVKEQKLVDKYGACAEFKYFDNYLESITALSSGNIDALAVTVSDTLMTVANDEKGGRFKVVLVNDISNGGDQLIVDGSKHKDIKSLKGKEVRLETGTVSHFVMAKAAAKVGLKLDDFKIVHTAADEVDDLFANGSASAIVTWNPNAMNAKKSASKEKKIKPVVAFSSKEIYGLIPDVLTINTEKVDDKTAQALVNAWFDVMAMMDKPESKLQALMTMAQSAGISREEYEALLSETQLFTSLDQAIAFMSGEGIEDPSAKGKKVTLAQATDELAKFLNQASDGEGNPFAKRVVDAKTLLEPKYQQAAKTRQ
jgi:NitT/TauT family transport system substrate-binding protein